MSVNCSFFVCLSNSSISLLICAVFIYLITYRTEDAEIIYHDADTLDMIGLEWAWIVSEQAFVAHNIPVGK